MENKIVKLQKDLADSNEKQNQMKRANQTYVEENEKLLKRVQELSDLRDNDETAYALLAAENNAFSEKFKKVLQENKLLADNLQEIQKNFSDSKERLSEHQISSMELKKAFEDLSYETDHLRAREQAVVKLRDGITTLDW